MAEESVKALELFYSYAQQDEALRAELWKVYYAQKGYWRKHGRYAAALTELGVEAPELWMKATDLQFTAGTGDGLMIDQDGKVARAGADRR